MYNYEITKISSNLNKTIRGESTDPLRLAGSKGDWEEDLALTTSFDGGKCFRGFNKKRIEIADTRAPRKLAVEIIVRSLEFMALVSLLCKQSGEEDEKIKNEMPAKKM